MMLIRAFSITVIPAVRRDHLECGHIVSDPGVAMRTGMTGKGM